MPGFAAKVQDDAQEDDDRQSVVHHCPNVGATKIQARLG
jgi:hypothetical protein